MEPTPRRGRPPGKIPRSKRFKRPRHSKSRKLEGNVISPPSTADLEAGPSAEDALVSSSQGVELLEKSFSMLESPLENETNQQAVETGQPSPLKLRYSQKDVSDSTVRGWVLGECSPVGGNVRPSSLTLKGSPVAGMCALSSETETHDRSAILIEAVQIRSDSGESEIAEYDNASPTEDRPRDPEVDLSSEPETMPAEASTLPPTEPATPNRSATHTGAVHIRSDSVHSEIADYDNSSPKEDRPPDPEVDLSGEPETTPAEASTLLPTAEVVLEGDASKLLADRVASLLPPQWAALPYPEFLYAMQVEMPPLRVHRAVRFDFNGDISVEVGGRTLPKSHDIYKDDMMKSPGRLSHASLDAFSSAVRRGAYAVQSYKKCIGVTADEAVENWTNHPKCELYSVGDQRVLRTRDCYLLVVRNQKRCRSCLTYQNALRLRETRRISPGKVKQHTAHKYLTPRRLKAYLKNKQHTIRNQAARLERLSGRVARMVQEEGVDMDDELEDNLRGCFDKADGLVKIFWEEQKKAHSVKKASGMKWHPFMIRWALYIKSTSAAAYSALRDSGIIKLPSERTLYEYIHANPSNEGIQFHVVERLADSLRKYDCDFNKFHVLMFDEIYLYKNIVYHKGTGAIVGYVKLNEIEQELAALEKELNEDEEKTSDPPVATTMLTYMVKGVANGNLAVVACYSCAALNKDNHKCRTWDVIGVLERAGVKVISLVGDGSAANAAFFDSHPSLYPTEGGVVYATLNIFTKDRPLFFFTDPPHLLKTTRNCLYNSGANRNTRLLQKNGQLLSWNTIIACLKSEERQDLKFCHKLNNQNVFLNGYSVMKVSLAAQVLSKTVALYIKNESGMKNVEELVKFIMYVNDFFDCLNGAHSSQATKTKNSNLRSYTDENDKRFDFLLEFLQYVKDWEAEVAALPLTDAQKRKRLMSAQWHASLERTIRGFIGATKFCLGTRIGDEGFIMARVWQQDPLEHYFSRQRACCGGNVHPTLQRFLENQNVIDLQGNLGIKQKRGNTQPLSERVDPDLPVPKRKKPCRKLAYDGNV